MEVIGCPAVRLEDIREQSEGNTCDGRGQATAAPRGYNVERLAAWVCRGIPNTLGPPEPWYDAHLIFGHEHDYDVTHMKVECKSCVNRYQSGTYGRFRIWRKHHERLLKAERRGYHVCIYFLLVYAIEDGQEVEVGKLAVPIELIDDMLDSWTEMGFHRSMAGKEYRDLSWRQVLAHLDIPVTMFQNEDTIDYVKIAALETIF